MHRFTRRAALALVCASLGLVAAPVAAQNFPSKPVRLIVT